LIALTILLVAVPLGVLACLGWLLIDQDRKLETQREHERLENAAIRLADSLAAAQEATGRALPPDSVRIVVGARGLIDRDGVALPYYPAVALQQEAPPGLFAAAETAEFQGAAPVRAAERYRILARSTDPAVRAGALMRLARVRRNQGRTEEALATYEDLAAMGGAVVFDSPAELVARRQRILLLDARGDSKAAADERKSLARVLSEGRYALDPVTLEFYSQDVTVEQCHPELASTVAEWWPRWELQPSGRTTWVTGNAAFAVVWRRAPQGLVAMVGRSVADGTQARQAAAYRRNLQIAGIAVMVLVIAVAGYLVSRALHRELAVARLQSDFVAQVSHEFRTPLTAMRHLTELLEERSALPDRLPQLFQALGKETRRLHTMVESLLDFGQMESGRRVYDMQRTSLSDLARDVADEFSPLRLQLNVPAEGPQIQADRDAMALALRNLVDNAMKYSPDRSPVIVTVEERAGAAGVSVEDRGAGVSRQEQREILRKFVRGHAARVMNVKGTGLGLAAVHQVVRAHGGRLEVQSGLGEGSRFTIWIPTTRARA